ncbi:MAG: creatininase family protein [Hyphomicrobiales bacterium]|nr:creatininase family protein [Hyphomicrobiales bacterium]
MTDSEVALARDADSIVAVPVGAIEQHGPHLPVNTDIVLSTAVTKAAAELTSATVLVAPELSVGFSPHHLSRPGTLSLRLTTFQMIVGETAAAIVASGFPRVVFVNGHGGNSAPLRAAVGELVTDGLPAAAIDYFAPSEATWAPMLSGALNRVGHACEFETALFMHLRSHDNEAVTRITRAKKGLPPRTVQPWLIPGDEDDPITAAGAAWPPIFQADDSGYYGDPAAATIDLGERLFAVVAIGLAEFFAAFAATPLRLGISRDPEKPSISPAIRNKD